MEDMDDQIAQQKFVTKPGMVVNQLVELGEFGSGHFVGRLVAKVNACLCCSHDDDHIQIMIIIGLSPSQKNQVNSVKKVQSSRTTFRLQRQPVGRALNRLTMTSNFFYNQSKY